MAAPVGNQNAAKAKRWQSAITRALAKVSDGQGVEAGLDKLAAQLVACALGGEQWALKEVGDRMDGKPAQALTVSGDEDGGPIKYQKVERVILRGKAADTDG